MSTRTSRARKIASAVVVKDRKTKQDKSGIETITQEGRRGKQTNGNQEVSTKPNISRANKRKIDGAQRGGVVPQQSDNSTNNNVDVSKVIDPITGRQTFKRSKGKEKNATSERMTMTIR